MNDFNDFNDFNEYKQNSQRHNSVPLQGKKYHLMYVKYKYKFRYM